MLRYLFNTDHLTLFQQGHARWVDAWRCSLPRRSVRGCLAV